MDLAMFSILILLSLARMNQISHLLPPVRVAKFTPLLGLCLSYWIFRNQCCVGSFFLANFVKNLFKVCRQPCTNILRFRLFPSLIKSICVLPRYEKRNRPYEYFSCIACSPSSIQHTRSKGILTWNILNKKEFIDQNRWCGLPHARGIPLWVLCYRTVIDSNEMSPS